MIGASEGWILMNIALSIATQTAPDEIYKAAALKQDWNTPGMIETFKVFQDMFKDVWQDGAVTATHYGDSWDAFRAGDTAMFCGGVASIGGLNEEQFKDLNVGVFRFPDVDGDGKPSMVCGGSDEQIMVNKNTKNPDEAAKIALSWAFGEGYDFQLNTLGGTYGYFDNTRPDTSSWNENSAYVFDELMEKSYDDIKYATSLNRDDTTSIFHETLKELAAFAITPEDAVKQLDQDCAAFK